MKPGDRVLWHRRGHAPRPVEIVKVREKTARVVDLCEWEDDTPGKLKHRDVMLTSLTERNPAPGGRGGRTMTSNVRTVPQIHDDPLAGWTGEGGKVVKIFRNGKRFRVEVNDKPLAGPSKKPRYFDSIDKAIAAGEKKAPPTKTVKQVDLNERPRPRLVSDSQPAKAKAMAKPVARKSGLLPVPANYGTIRELADEKLAEALAEHGFTQDGERLVGTNGVTVQKSPHEDCWVPFGADGAPIRNSLGRVIYALSAVTVLRALAQAKAA